MKRLAVLSLLAVGALAANPVAKLNPHPKKMMHVIKRHPKLEAAMGGIGLVGLLCGRVYLSTAGSQTSTKKPTHR